MYNGRVVVDVAREMSNFRELSRTQRGESGLVHKICNVSHGGGMVHFDLLRCVTHPKHIENFDFFSVTTGEG